MVTAVPSESGSAVKARPHMRRNAMAKPMNRLVPTPPASRATLRRRATTSDDAGKVSHGHGSEERVQHCLFKRDRGEHQKARGGEGRNDG